jgi:geranylgeranyl diphosphate synthase, type II
LSVLRPTGLSSNGITTGRYPPTSFRQIEYNALQDWAGAALAGTATIGVDDMAHVRQETLPPTRDYLHLLRTARGMFEPDELERLAPRLRNGPRLAEVNGQGVAALDPIAATETIAYDFLSKGGKYSRPFITLAAYHALTGPNGAEAHGAVHDEQVADAVRRAALSIEAFHKASLVHDDIQDGDAFRYGEPTLHEQHGVATAINVGDYLIGLGYRLASRDTSTLGADTAADILNKLADAHTKLSEGQGAELVWRDSRDKRLTPSDALNIYALKTAPAFEAAMYCGLRLAGPAKHYARPVTLLAKHVGIAFQILNDLKDWQSDDYNKLLAGGDVLGGRPTVLWALALEGLEEDSRLQLDELVAQADPTPETLDQLRGLYQRAGVFESALRLVDEHQALAVVVADQLQPAPLRSLAHYLIDTVLQRQEAGPPVARLAIPAR